MCVISDVDIIIIIIIIIFIVKVVLSGSCVVPSQTLSSINAKKS